MRASTYFSKTTTPHSSSVFLLAYFLVFFCIISTPWYQSNCILGLKCLLKLVSLYFRKFLPFWIFVPLNSCVPVLTSITMTARGGTSRRCLGHEGGALKVGSVPCWETPQSLWLLLPGEDTAVGSLQPEECSHQDLTPPNSWTCSLQNRGK